MRVLILGGGTTRIEYFHQVDPRQQLRKIGLSGHSAVAQDAGFFAEGVWNQHQTALSLDLGNHPFKLRARDLLLQVQPDDM